MPSYWWECESCSARTDFSATCGSPGVAHFIWDALLPSGWDQALLVRPCNTCGTRTVRIAYEFPRSDSLTLRIVHLVGLDPHDIYLQMMWESYPTNSPEQRWFDFKYLNGRSLWGLNKPAVFAREELGAIFDVYRRKTGVSQFP